MHRTPGSNSNSRSRVILAIVLGLGLHGTGVPGWVHPAAAATPYKLPPREIVDILDAPAPPAVWPSPDGSAALLVDLETAPPIELLSRPFLKLAGVRVDPAIAARRREFRFLRLRLQDLRTGAVARAVTLPTGSTFSAPQWSYDGERFAFLRDAVDGVELWVCDAKSLAARVVPGVHVNDVLGNPLRWSRDNRHILVRAVPAGRGPAPAGSRVPSGPDVQETAGKTSRMATFRDLLENGHDEELFEYYATSQLLRVDAKSLTAEPVGAPGLLESVALAPNGEYLLVDRILRPFSFRVQYDSFAHAIEVWGRDGKVLATVAQLPVADEVPQQGVATGVREVEWQPLHPASLVWAEALDGGDPMAKVPHRDRVMRLDVRGVLGKDPAGELAAQGRELLRVKERFAGIEWTGRRDQAMIDEYDRGRRWQTTWLVSFAIAGGAQRKIFDRNINDAYADPGTAVLQVRPNGEAVMRQDGDFIYLSGRGSTPKGDRPFLDRMNLRSLEKARLFQCGEKSDERFLAFVSSTRILTTYQSRTEPPNQYLVDLLGKRRVKLTDYADPAPQMTGIEKRLLKYHRADGTPLTAFLYLPPGYQPGTRIPMMLWAYPREFSDAGTAGQVRGSENGFVRLTGASHLFFLAAGYAVLDDPTMPVLGDPETMNDTYVEQIVAAAKAAVDTVVAMGIADPDRIGIGGHSYGAFMTANLLAHSDLFAAGIARSGAYNRTLTPFGFQSERRSFWEAPEVYMNVSPFRYASKINEPILLIHGEEDTNSGTFPIQSERMFQALQGNGATARLVMLPFEGHGYRARESVLHTLAEMLDWANQWVKDRPAGAVQESKR